MTYWPYREVHNTAIGVEWNPLDRDNVRKKAEQYAYKGSIEDTFHGYMYRFDYQGGRVKLSAFLIKHPTPKGHTVYLIDGSLKFVSDQWNRKFACLTIQQAQQSFIARKEKQKAILQSKIAIIDMAIKSL